jgi:hypothetical protein
MPETTHTHSWPELAIGLFEHLTGRGAEISYEFEDMKIKVPSGGMKIRTKDQSNRPN